MLENMNGCVDRMSITPVDVLIIGRNRFQHLQKLLESSALKKNVNVYIFLDGGNCEEVDVAEREKLEKTQFVAKTYLSRHPNRLFISPRKLGCYRGVTTAIDWFFQQVKCGLILEDDLLPHPEIIPLTSQALNVFEEWKNIGSISFYRTGKKNSENRFSFSRYPSSWGWATWKDRWEEFDHKSDRKIRFKPFMLYKRGGLKGLRRWCNVISRLKRNELDSWAYRWLFTFWLKNYYTVVFPFNLIENHGFGNDATHTKVGSSKSISYEEDGHQLSWEIDNWTVDDQYDEQVLRIQYGIK